LAKPDFVRYNSYISLQSSSNPLIAEGQGGGEHPQPPDSEKPRLEPWLLRGRARTPNPKSDDPLDFTGQLRRSATP
jgi:hypothetical protein